MYVKATACGPSRRTSDMDAHRAPWSLQNRPDRPSRPVGFSSKPTHKLTHFHMSEERKSIISHS